MGSVTDQGGDWKGGHMRIDSNEHEPTGSSDSGKGDDIELRNQDKAQEVAGGRRRQYPDALGDEDPSSVDEAIGDGTFQFYRVYKRRWFGLVQLTLLNIVVSWDVSTIFHCYIVFALMPLWARVHLELLRTASNMCIGYCSPRDDTELCEFYGTSQCKVSTNKVIKFRKG